MSELPIHCQKRHIEDFGQCHEGRVVRSQVRAQLPDPTRQRHVRVAANRKPCEVAQRLLDLVVGERSPSAQPPQCVEELDVDQMWCVQVAVAREPCYQIRAVS